MSCVALLNATSMNNAKLVCSQNAVGRQRATLANAAPITNCILRIHQRLVRIMSTNGLQRGFITQGSPNQLVYRAICVSVNPIS